ncbi:hypothetical protein IJH97_02385 [Candidatus Saccharibacteria bacterium]|nr:hypothetical protein [Candidatus Saccharibacteria bacterium]
MVDLPSDATDQTKTTDEPVAAPVVSDKPKKAAKLPDALEKVVDRIEAADSILVALSKDPNVDEMAAAIALTMMLDNSGKHATAIYSGDTPNALEFLKPEETFETDTNSLQDFIIALNKEKADHLRYKIEGDFVKVYITPYKTTLTEKDLDFEHGDFNVDLVVSLDVPSGDDLDAALSEYGRIMHDATAVNITTGEPGRFAEVEWSEPEASSVCEMIVRLQGAMKDKAALDEQVATALLTGIVAATERFSNDKTSPKTMEVASKLMNAGADQKLISENLTKSGVKKSAAEEEIENLSKEPGSLDVKHEDEEEPAEATETEKPVEEVKPEEPVLQPISADPTAEVTAEPTPQQQLDQLIQPLTAAPTVTPEVVAEPAPTLEAPILSPSPEVAVPAGDTVAAPEVPPAPINTDAVYGSATAAPLSDTPVLNAPDVITPEATGAGASSGPSLAGGSVLIDRDKDYSKMMDEELAEPAPVLQPTQPVADVAAGENPAVVAAPEVSGEAVLPPPPAPPIDPTALTPTPAPTDAPNIAPVTPEASAEPAADVPAAAPTDAPGAFQIPQA